MILQLIIICEDFETIQLSQCPGLKYSHKLSLFPPEEYTLLHIFSLIIKLLTYFQGYFKISL